MVQRLTYRRRHSFNTRSNKVKIVKTPGGVLKFQHRSKLAKGPSCGDCGIQIQGIPHLRPKEYARLPKSQRTVTRAYGGSRCALCVRNRIVRAFLIEEQKIVKAVLKTKEKEKKAADKAAEKAEKSGKKSKKAVKP